MMMNLELLRKEQDRKQVFEYIENNKERNINNIYLKAKRSELYVGVITLIMRYSLFISDIHTSRNLFNLLPQLL